MENRPRIHLRSLAMKRNACEGKGITLSNSERAVFRV